MTHDNSTHSTSSRSRIEEDRQREEDRAGSPGTGAVMRVIIPLQGVVQGRGGVVLGSVIPCALFYFLQLYLKRHRSERAPRDEVPPPPRRPSSSHPKPVLVSSRALHVIEDENSPYYLGWKAYKQNPYDAENNPSGVIQMGLAENQVGIHCFGQ
jgi:aminotransferase